MTHPSKVTKTFDVSPAVAHMAIRKLPNLINCTNSKKVGRNPRGSLVFTGCDGETRDGVFQMRLTFERQVCKRLVVHSVNSKGRKYYQLLGSADFSKLLRLLARHAARPEENQ